MEFQWLARYWAPDCSHSHIMRPGGILIILIILLVHFTSIGLDLVPAGLGFFIKVPDPVCIGNRNGIEDGQSVIGTGSWSVCIVNRDRDRARARAVYLTHAVYTAHAAYTARAVYTVRAVYTAHAVYDVPVLSVTVISRWDTEMLD